jgi:hypothetical protein
MFSAMDNLGNPYKPTTIPKIDVSFVPVNNEKLGIKSYIAIVQDDNDVGLPLDEPDVANSGTEFSKLYKQGGIYATPTPDDDDDDKNTGDIFSLGKDPVKVFYIGSVTVVGLYILYRILTKTK